jgi:phosphoribosylaminoimidazolecarboxamide formyltransferase/IMP cyclohydrolase
LKYGENPHQTGALYTHPGTPSGVAGAEQLAGPDLGYMNYLDADSAWRSASGLSGTAVAIVKHANPCGLSRHDDQAEAYRRALAGDPVSAYGGIVGFNSTVTAATAEAMKGVLYHVLIAPGYEPEALESLKNRKSARILQVTRPASRPLLIRSISGGVLIQHQDPANEAPEEWDVKTDQQPTPEQIQDLLFAVYSCAMIKSNAIVMVKDQSITGMGAGQPNRVMSVDIAGRVAGGESNGSVLASDAFFPFADSIEAADEAGISAVIAPGGSIRDDEVVAEANKRGIVLVFTPYRHFLH